MIVTNSINTNYQKQQNFTSRSSKLGQIDDIFRRATREFPVISESKMIGYDSLQSSYNMTKYRKYIQRGISEIRSYTTKSEPAEKTLLRELDAIKRYRLGNCTECADIAYTALRMNGYKDAEVMWLYAYNPKTNKMRDIDHAVVGVNFKKPEGYEYCPLYQMHFGQPDPKYKLFPGNEGIIVDTWLGTAEYGKNLEGTYRNNKALIRSRNEQERWHGRKGQFTTLLSPDEKLCYVPVETRVNFTDEYLLHLNNTYNGLLLDKNKTAVSELGEKESKKFAFTPMSETIIKELKAKFKLKNSEDIDSIRLKIEEDINAQLKDKGYAIDKPKKKGFMTKIKSFFVENF